MWWVILILVIILILAAWSRLIEIGLFEIDPNNKYRRKCRECGQFQEEFGELHNDSKGYWQRVGPVLEPKCICHYYSRE